MPNTAKFTASESRIHATTLPDGWTETHLWYCGCDHSTFYPTKLHAEAAARQLYPEGTNTNSVVWQATFVREDA